MIDIGVNLCNRSFDHDRPEVIERALQAGVEKIILTGTSIKSSRQHLYLAKQYPGRLYSTAGIHPHDAKSYKKNSKDSLRTLLASEEVIAVGECGLDFNRDFSPRPIQEECFEAQLQLAAEGELPLFMHQRDAHQRFMAILTKYRDKFKHGVVHCFTGVKEEMHDYLDLDLHIGITGWICDERRGFHLKEFVKNIPLKRLMIETDAPYLTPRNMRPKPKKGRNEPAFLPHIANEIAACFDISSETFNKSVKQTTERFFKL